ncbi:MAG: hypothetical protein IPP58_01915 [Holophagaceae bacterium]|uniref:UvrB interaction domain-containing protein n=1 Tax=Candidatus Geothrix skivensis TaxID=2954439 RepID=A0A9D7SFE9_9BACT|nr:hypothetical protein [Candidatus Geothrix skivensis]
MLVTGPLTASEAAPPHLVPEAEAGVAQGRRSAPGLLLETLIALGYRRAEMASAPGEFSSRGMVVDLWPDHLGNPCAWRPSATSRSAQPLRSRHPAAHGRRWNRSCSIPASGDRGHGEAPAGGRGLPGRPHHRAEDDLAFRRTRLATHDHFPGRSCFISAGPTKGQLVHWVPPCLRIRLDGAWEEALRDAEQARIDEKAWPCCAGRRGVPRLRDRFLPAAVPAGPPCCSPVASETTVPWPPSPSASSRAASTTWRSTSGPLPQG